MTLTCYYHNDKDIAQLRGHIGWTEVITGNTKRTDLLEIIKYVTVLPDFLIRK